MELTLKTGEKSFLRAAGKRGQNKHPKYKGFVIKYNVKVSSWVTSGRIRVSQLLNTITRSKRKSPNRKYKFGTPFYTRVTECRMCTGLNEWCTCTQTDSEYSVPSERRRWYRGKTRVIKSLAAVRFTAHVLKDPTSKTCSCVKNTSSKNKLGSLLRVLLVWVFQLRQKENPVHC